MTSRTVDQLARLARGADAPALDDATARRLVDAAIARAHFEPTVAPRRPVLRWAAAGALAVAAVIAFVVLHARPAPATLHLALPTGDVLTGTAGAHFAIAELTPSSRKLRLDAGTIVCDVAHVVAGQHFEVTAGDVTVVATGTVFSVSAAGHVHVYEGTVEVHRGAQIERLAAGASSPAGSSGEDPRELVDAGEAAARARSTHVAAVVPPPAPTTRIVMVPVVVPIRVPVEVRESAAPIGLSAAHAVAEPTPAVAPPPPAAAPPAAPLADDALSAARADIAAARYSRALDKVAAAPHPLSGAWLLVDSDALRALGKKREAADALAQAAGVLDGTAQTEAAYSAAYLRWHELHDADGALAVLTAGDVDVPGSLFEERGLVLHVAILAATKRRADAQPLAQRYLDHFPLGEQRAQMLAITRAQDASK